MIREQKIQEGMDETFYLSVQGYLDVLGDQTSHSGKSSHQHNSDS
jgi:hypothetical protein